MIEISNLYLLIAILGRY